MPSHTPTGRRVLLTGGAGFIGSHLVDAFVSRGDHVTVLDDFSTGRRENLAHLADSPLLEVVEGSVGEETVVDDLMSEAEVCLHLASAVGVQLITSNPLASLLGNVRGTDVVLNTAARRKVRVLYASTSEVYGKMTEGALSEDSDRILGSPYKSRWAYAIAKGFGESLAYGLHRDAGAETITIRLFNTVGPRQSGRYGMVLPRFVAQALAGEELTVFGNGTQTRCFAHVSDAVHGIQLLLDTDDAVGRVVNIGNTVEMAIIELARRVIERAESDSTIRLVPYSDAYAEGFEELGKRKPDTTLMRKLTGWAPTRTIDDAIDDTIAYTRGVAEVGRGLPVAP